MTKLLFFKDCLQAQILPQFGNCLNPQKALKQNVATEFNGRYQVLFKKSHFGIVLYCTVMLIAVVSESSHFKEVWNYLFNTIVRKLGLYLGNSCCVVVFT